MWRPSLRGRDKQSCQVRHFHQGEMVYRDCLPRREHRRLHLRRITRIRLRRRTPDIGLGLFRHGANVLREIRRRMGWLQPQKGGWLKLRQFHRKHRGRDRGRRGRERPRYDPKLGLWLPQQTTLLHLLFHGLRFRPVPARRELGTERLRLLTCVADIRFRHGDHG